ncbi:Thioesterase/thiol ester dehydrase-isomerase [Biscogniauxia mediterranea]|nr:Thioesterase/thiol ester dehydrase-isomerase [Biscogniauxia mediterranea]
MPITNNNNNTPSSARLRTHVDYFISQGVGILQAPATLPFLPPSRQGSDQLSSSAGSEGVFVSRDRLFKHLLDNERAIPHYIGFCADPFRDPCPPAGGFPDLPFIAKSITLVLELRDGLRGFNGTVHGGLTCAIMDEAMGTLLFQNDLLGREAEAKGLVPAGAAAKGRFPAAVTAEMNVRYRRPLPTPQIVLVTASLERVEGRKTHMRVVVEDKEGREYASCTGTFIALASTKL